MLSVKAFLLSALLLASHCTPARAEDDPTFLNTVYLIRNAEMNGKHVGSGLSPEGFARAACLPSVRPSAPPSQRLALTHGHRCLARART